MRRVSAWADGDGVRHRVIVDAGRVSVLYLDGELAKMSKANPAALLARASATILGAVHGTANAHEQRAWSLVPDAERRAVMDAAKRAVPCDIAIEWLERPTKDSEAATVSDVCWGTVKR